MAHHVREDSAFVRFLGWFFGSCGNFVCDHTWLLIALSCLLSAIGTYKIPFTKLSNKISDFTPLDAPSFVEYESYANFYEDRSSPNTIYAFVTAKGGGSMFTLNRMTEAINVLDAISNDFKMDSVRGQLSYNEFCRAFCVINEPVRTFYNGMRLAASLEGNDTSIDISYPDTSVLGNRMHMDPNLFGAMITVIRNGSEVVVPTEEARKELNEAKQLRNNLRSFELVVFNFKSELDAQVRTRDVEKWEHAIVNYYNKEFKSDEIEVTIFADSFITSEVVRSGLVLLPFLVIGFVIMAVFSAASFSVSALLLNQMSFDKIILSVVACVCPFMACGAGMGLMLWLGMRFGTILCVTPFLILAISVDDAYLMVNAWQQITSERVKKSLRTDDPTEELRTRMREMLTETGPSIAITTITNVMAFAISAYGSSPEIQLFSIGNAICVFIDFLFVISLYSSFMAIAGRREIKKEYCALEAAGGGDKLEKSAIDISALAEVHWNKTKKSGTRVLKKLLHKYVRALTSTYVALAVMVALGGYLVWTVYYMLHIQPELKPEKLFLRDSSLQKLFARRQQHIIPHYSVAWIYVQSPGDIWDPTRRAQIDAMINEYESLPDSIGHYSTKFFLRDFEEFAKTNSDLLNGDLFDDPDAPTPSNYSKLINFLSWPENSYWKGFVQFENIKQASIDNGTDPKIVRLMFTTSYQGEHLKDWTNRVILLKQWREVATHYPDMNITVYQEDSKFLDIIDTMKPVAISSAVLTFLSMFVVTLLFIPQPLILCTATFTILSTSLGVIGVMAWLGVGLDPVFLASIIMSIGFSVDIPAHIGYHFHQTGAHSSDVVERVEHTIARVGFPIIEASLSTILCVSSLFFVDLHMSTTFGLTMLLVVVIGTLHGLIVMPAIFGLFGRLSNPFSACCKGRVGQREKGPSSPAQSVSSISLEDPVRANSTATILRTN